MAEFMDIHGVSVQKWNTRAKQKRLSVINVLVKSGYVSGDRGELPQLVSLPNAIQENGSHVKSQLSEGLRRFIAELSTRLAEEAPALVSTTAVAR